MSRNECLILILLSKFAVTCGCWGTVMQNRKTFGNFVFIEQSRNIHFFNSDIMYYNKKCDHLYSAFKCY